MSELTFRPITPILGAEVEGVDLTADLPPETVSQLRSALLRHKVLVFREQRMTDEQQIGLSAAFGDVTPAHPIINGLREHPEILRTEHSARRPDADEPLVTFDSPLGDATPSRIHTEWHIDNTFVANPTSITILRGVEIPAAGGDTLFADLEALYSSLSPSFQGYLETLQGIHSRYDRAAEPRFDGLPAGPFVAVHPLVRVHPETQARSLVISTVFLQAIHNLKPRESALLLNYLLEELAGRDEFQARIRWAQDTLVMWDNRAVAHAGPVDGRLFAEERIVHRTTVAGEVPQSPTGFVSYSLVGEEFEPLR